MSWYFRKSKSFGPFRINLSNSGFSYSLGVKGARISTGKRGTYVSLGTNGIYYRRKLSSPPTLPNQHPHLPSQEQQYSPHTITSAPVEQLTDTDSEDFVNELNTKAQKKSLLNWVGIPITVVVLVSCILYSSGIIRKVQNKAYSLRLLPSAENVNLRDQPSPKAKVIGKASPFDQYVYLDSVNGWNRIKLPDSTVAYVSGALSQKDSSVVSTSIYTRLDTSPNAVGSTSFISLSGCLFLCLFLRKLDKKRMSMEINYDMDDKINEVYGKFLEYFKEGASSQRLWQILHSQGTTDWKRNAGAGKLVNRIVLKGWSADKKPAPFFHTNIQIPNISLKGTDMYFFPERLVIKKAGKFAAVFYKHISVRVDSLRFIEDEWTPGDAQVVDRTWKFLNKNGTPDRRFNNNRQLPICLYGHYTFHSDQGVYETICTSRQDSFLNFSNFLGWIGNLQQKMEIN
jgi:hypothetical protein